MPARKPTAQRCAICSNQTAKYTCPADQVPYCSVKCFKQHKEAALCSGSRETVAPLEGFSSDLLASTDADSTPASSAQTNNALADRPLDRPLKRLRDLRWPPEPDSTVFIDPLRRHEVKPLRGFELEAIAMHRPMRTMLVPESSPLDPPSLRSVLRHIAALKTYEEKEAALRELLKAPLPPSKDRLAEGERTGPQDPGAAGRGGRGRGRGRGRTHGSERSRDAAQSYGWAADPAAQQVALKFADEVRKVLTEAREKGA